MRIDVSAGGRSGRSRPGHGSRRPVPLGRVVRQQKWRAARYGLDAEIAAHARGTVRRCLRPRRIAAGSGRDLRPVVDALLDEMRVGLPL